MVSYHLSKKGFEFGFGWFFALLVGGVIIFASFFIAWTLVNQQRTEVDSSLAKQFETVLYPLGTGLESDKITSLYSSTPSQVSITCSSLAPFGEQAVSVESSSSLGKTIEPAPASKSKDNYLFFSSPMEDKKFNALVKAFNFPFKVSDVIILLPLHEKYCFINAPTVVSNDLAALTQTTLLNESFFFTTTLLACPAEAKRFCFAGTDSHCDAVIYYNAGKIVKASQTVEFIPTEKNQALFYAALFSEPTLYECQLKRLMLRSYELSMLYTAKAQRLQGSSCGQGLDTDLSMLANATLDLQQSEGELANVALIAKNLEVRNNALSCPLF